MNKALLNTINQDFINRNLNNDTHSILLKSHANITIDIKLLIEQIEAKKKCKLKLPTWYNSDNVYYPNKLNIEQTSSEITAAYKAKLLNGKSIIDLTGGFGVDCFYFAKHFTSVTHCEINTDLSEIAAHNFVQLNTPNIKTVPENGMSHLIASNQTYDCIYIDPSRRHEHKGKVFYLNDCLPNVPEHLDLLFKHSNTVLIKASPMLDISLGISELRNIKSVHIIAVNNDVKELLFLIEKDYSNPIKIHTVNINKGIPVHFDFFLKEEQKIEINYAITALKYLFEPNAAILKSGGFKSIGRHYELLKLHQHTHLYTSDTLVDFPGRRFVIQHMMAYNKKEILKYLKNTACHITTRNFPESVAQLKAKFKTKDGGDLYVFFTTNHDNKKIVIFTKKA